MQDALTESEWTLTLGTAGRHFVMVNCQKLGLEISGSSCLAAKVEARRDTA